MICVLVEEEWLVKNNYYTIQVYIIYKVHAYSPFHKCWWAFGSNH